jgi:predicted acylesterase/phospholipase RssA
MASLSWPGLFPPAQAFGSEWFDGSAVYDIDIFTAIGKCKSLGYKDENIVVDAILTSAASI